MDPFAHPFRVLPNGEFATVPADSDLAYAEELAVLALTRREERPLVPDYGTADPVGDGYDEADVIAQAELYGPPVRVLSVIAEPTSMTTEDVTIVFERDDEEE